MSEPRSINTFDDAFRQRLRDLFAWRRDVRHFRPVPLPSGTLERLIEVAAFRRPWA